ncbi:MAG: hypothetical protein WCM76_05385 [Bacteroidota bacterium]
MRLFLIGLLLGFLTFSTTAQDVGILPGMPLDSFTQRYPALRQYEEKSRTQIYRDEIVHGLNGSWLYQFEEGHLKWFCYSFFTFNDKDLTEQNFNLCRDATLQFISAQNKKSGKPSLLKKRSPRFEKIRKKNTNTTVIRAVWETANMNFSVAYKYVEPNRGRSAYLSVEMWFYGPDHPLL